LIARGAPKQAPMPDKSEPDAEQLSLF